MTKTQEKLNKLIDHTIETCDVIELKKYYNKIKGYESEILAKWIKDKSSFDKRKYDITHELAEFTKWILWYFETLLFENNQHDVKLLDKCDEIYCKGRKKFLGLED